MSKPAHLVLRDRDRSPKPVRSPSPDYVAKSSIVSTRTPNATEIAELARLSNPTSKIPLLEEISELRKENQELHDRLNALTRSSVGRQSVPVGISSPNGVNRTEVSDLHEQLREKEAEIEALKQATAGGARLKHASSMNTNGRLTPSKKISLIKTESYEGARQRPFAEDVDEPISVIKESYSLSEVDKLHKRIKELERENDDLHRENTRLRAEELNRGSSSRFMFDKSASPEKAGGDTDRALALAQKTKVDLQRNLEDLRIRMSNKIHELQQRILSISKKLSEISSKKLGDSRPRYGESSRKDDRSQDYLTKTNEQLHNQLTQLSQQLEIEHTAHSQARRQLEAKEGELKKLIQTNGLLQREVLNLNTYMKDAPEDRNTPREALRDPSSPARDNSIQKLLRLERQNGELKTQISTINGFLEQVRNEKIQKDIDITNLSKSLVELRTQVGRVDHSWNQQDISRLQSDNKMLRDTLESLRDSHSDLLTQLERARKDFSVQPAQQMNSQSMQLQSTFASETDKLKEILQLKSEVGRLKALNEILMKDKSDLLRESGLDKRESTKEWEKTEKKESGTWRETDRRVDQGLGYRETERKDFGAGYTPDRSDKRQYGTGAEFRLDRKEFGYTPQRSDYGTGGEFRLDIKQSEKNTFKGTANFPSSFTPERSEFGTGGEFRIKEEKQDFGSEFSPERRDTGTGEFRWRESDNKKEGFASVYERNSERKDQSVPGFGTDWKDSEKRHTAGLSRTDSKDPEKKSTITPIPVPTGFPDWRDTKTDYTPSSIDHQQVWEREKKELIARFQQEKKKLASELSAALEDVTREKERSTLRDKDYQNVKLTLERVNSEIQQIPSIKEQCKKDIEKYKRLAQENSLDLNIMNKEKEALESALVSFEQTKKRNDDLQLQLRRKDEQIIELRKPKRSAEFDSILRELSDLRHELDRLDLDPLKQEFHGRTQRLKSLLTDKASQIRLVQRSQSELETLQRENSTLKKQILQLNSKYLGEKEENQRTKATLQALQLQKEIFQREISRLREIINEYVNQRDRKDELVEHSQLTEDSERQLRVIDEEIYRTESVSGKTVGELDSLKTEVRKAMGRIDTISDRIVHELAQPR